jgi:hypothetical protein
MNANPLFKVDASHHSAPPRPQFVATLNYISVQKYLEKAQLQSSCSGLALLVDIVSPPPQFGLRLGD